MGRARFGAVNTSTPMSGVLIAESFRLGADGDLPSVCLSRVRRSQVDDTGTVWTLLDFTCPAERAEALAARLAELLSDEGGWYADFGNNDLHFVIFVNKVFCYVPGDADARVEIEDYGRSHGIPDAQLDWRDAEG